MSAENVNTGNVSTPSAVNKNNSDQYKIPTLTEKISYGLGDVGFNISDIPLVLHGASGLSNRDVRQAIDYGHAKINFNTELNLNRANALRQLFNEEPKMYDPKIISEVENKALKDVITEKLKLCYL